MSKQQNAAQETDVHEKEKRTVERKKSPKQSCVKYENKDRKSALQP